MHELKLSIQSNLAVVLVQSIRDQTNSRLAHQIGRGFSSKTQRIKITPDLLQILLRNGRGFSMKSKWIKFAPGRLLDRFLGSNVRARMKKSYQRQLVHHCDICLKLMKDFHKQSIWDEKVKLSKALDLGIAPLHYLLKSSHPIVNNS